MQPVQNYAFRPVQVCKLNWAGHNLFGTAPNRAKAIFCIIFVAPVKLHSQLNKGNFSILRPFACAIWPLLLGTEHYEPCESNYRHA